MRYLDQYINNSPYSFLEVTVYDNDDIEALSRYRYEKNVMMDLCYLKYLPYFNCIERLILKSGEIPINPHTFFRGMSALKSLKLDYEETEADTQYCIDISPFPNLEYLFARSSYNFCGLANSKSLKTLVVGNWYEKDLSSIQNANLDTLNIFNGKLTSLRGIEKLPLLILSLSYQRKLTEISEVKQLPLKVLEIENCARIQNLEQLSSSTIECLSLIGNNKVASLEFLRQFPHLKRVMFDIQIEDGDLAILDQLEHAVILTDKRHFNRKYKQLPKTSKQYVLPEVPQWRCSINL